MKTQVEKAIALIASASFALASCTVDKDYQFEGSPDEIVNSIDTSVNLFENGIDIPVGSSTKKTLLELIGNETSTLKTDADGNYLIAAKSTSDFQQEFVLPLIQIEPINIATSEILNYDFAPGLIGYPHPEFSETINLNDQLNINVDQIIEADKIIDIRRIELNAPVKVTFDVNAGGYTIKSGSKITFPEQLELKAISDCITIEGKKTAIFNKDFYVAPGGDAVSIAIVGFALSSGNYVKEGGVAHLRINAQATVNGNIEIKGTNFTTVPSNFTATYEINSGYANIDRIEGKVEASENIVVPSIAIEAPTVLKESKLILSDPAIKFTITNNSEFDLILSTTVQTFKNGAKIEELPVNVTVPADKVSDVYLCKEDHQVPTGAIAVRNNNITNLTKEFPDEVRFLSPVARVSTPNYQMFTLDRTRHTALGYDISFPIAMKTGSEMNLEYTIEGLDLDLGSLESASLGLAFDAASTIPAEFKISATALDKNGEEVKNIQAFVINKEGNDIIKGGTLAKEAITPLTISLVIYEGADLSSVDGFKLDMKASVPSYCEDQCFNVKQYIQLRNIKAHVGNIEIGK